MSGRLLSKHLKNYSLQARLEFNQQARTMTITRGNLFWDVYKQFENYNVHAFSNSILQAF